METKQMADIYSEPVKMKQLPVRLSCHVEAASVWQSFDDKGSLVNKGNSFIGDLYRKTETSKYKGKIRCRAAHFT